MTAANGAFGAGQTCGTALAPLENQAIRLDVWLLRARFYKSRSLCTKIVRDGAIRLNRRGQIMRVNKPNTIVRPGDRLTFMRGEELFHIEVCSAGTRRGPALEAQTMYTQIVYEQERLSQSGAVAG